MIAADELVFGPPDMPLRSPDEPPHPPWWHCHRCELKWCGGNVCWLCGGYGMPAAGGFVTHLPQRAAPYFPGGAAREMEVSYD